MCQNDTIWTRNGFQRSEGKSPVKIESVGMAIGQLDVLQLPAEISCHNTEHKMDAFEMRSDTGLIWLIGGLIIAE